MRALQAHELTPSEISAVVDATHGYSGSDLQKLCQDAAMGPLRDEGVDIQTLNKEKVRPVKKKDFDDSMAKIRASVDNSELERYGKWNDEYGLSLR